MANGQAPNNKPTENPAGERWTAFWVGVGLLAVLLVIALMVDEPTPLLYLVVRVILSLAAAAFALFLTGMLQVKLPGVRAAGAFAVFVIVFFWNPAPLVLPEPEEPEGVDQVSVHVADTKSAPQENIQIGAVLGSLVKTNQAGQATLPLSQAVEAWQRIEVQLGPDSNEAWRLLDRFIRAPDSVRDYETILLVERGCTDCLQAEVVARQAVQYAWLENPESPEKGLIDLAASWQVEMSDLESSIALLAESEDPLDQAYAALYNREPPHRQMGLLKAARSKEIRVILADESTREEGLKAVDELFKVDMLLFAADPDNLPMVRSTEGVRKFYEDAYLQHRVGNLDPGRKTFTSLWDPSLFMDLVVENGA